MPTTQNGQTHSNIFVDNSRRIVWVCLTILWDHFNAIKLLFSRCSKKTKQNKKQIASFFWRAPRISRLNEFQAQNLINLVKQCQIKINNLSFRNVMYWVLHKRNYAAVSLAERLEISEKMSFRNKIWLANWDQEDWDQETRFRKLYTLIMLCTGCSTKEAILLLLSQSA